VSNATMLTLLAVLQGLTVAGILGAVGFAFKVNGQLREILTRLTHLERDTGRVQILSDQTLRNEIELGATKLRVDQVERRLDDLED